MPGALCSRCASRWLGSWRPRWTGWRFRIERIERKISKEGGYAVSRNGQQLALRAKTSFCFHMLTARPKSCPDTKPQSSAACAARFLGERLKVLKFGKGF